MRFAKIMAMAIIFFQVGFQNTLLAYQGQSKETQNLLLSVHPNWRAVISALSAKLPVEDINFIKAKLIELGLNEDNAFQATIRDQSLFIGSTKVIIQEKSLNFKGHVITYKKNENFSENYKRIFNQIESKDAHYSFFISEAVAMEASEKMELNAATIALIGGVIALVMDAPLVAAAVAVVSVIGYIKGVTLTDVDSVSCSESESHKKTRESVLDKPIAKIITMNGATYPDHSDFTIHMNDGSELRVSSPDSQKDLTIEKINHGKVEKLAPLDIDKFRGAAVAFLNVCLESQKQMAGMKKLWEANMHPTSKETKPTSR